MWVASWWWLLVEGSSSPQWNFCTGYLNALMTMAWQLAFPKSGARKGKKERSLLWLSFGTHLSSASFYSLEGSQGVVEFSSPSKEDGLASAFERKMHQRICKCILKLPHQIPIILDFILPIYFAYMIIPTYYPYNVSIFLFSISKCDQKATVGGMVLPDTPNEGLDNII